MPRIISDPEQYRFDVFPRTLRLEIQEVVAATPDLLHDEVAPVVSFAHKADYEGISQLLRALKDKLTGPEGHEVHETDIGVMVATPGTLRRLPYHWRKEGDELFFDWPPRNNWHDFNTNFYLKDAPRSFDSSQSPVTNLGINYQRCEPKQYNAAQVQAPLTLAVRGDVEFTLVMTASVRIGAHLPEEEIDNITIPALNDTEYPSPINQIYMGVNRRARMSYEFYVSCVKSTLRGALDAMILKKVHVAVVDPDFQHLWSLSEPNPVVWPLDGITLNAYKAEFCSIVEQVLEEEIANAAGDPVARGRFFEAIIVPMEEFEGAPQQYVPLGKQHQISAATRRLERGLLTDLKVIDNFLQDYVAGADACNYEDCEDLKGFEALVPSGL